MASSSDFDVVVLGSGFAGLSSALAAKELGLSVVVIEKSELVGGGSAWSQGAVWVGANDLAREAGLSDDLVAAARYVEVLAGGEGDPDRMRAFVQNAPAALNLFRSIGIPFVLVEKASDHLYHLYGKGGGGVTGGRTLEAAPFEGRKLGSWRAKLQTPQDPNWRLSLTKALSAKSHHEVQAIIREAEEQDLLCWGAGLIAHFLYRLIEKGVPVETGRAPAALLAQDGRVVGVEMQDGQTFLARRGVVIATGGYDSNPTMARELEGLPDFQSVFPDSITGDGLKLGLSVGGALAKIGNSLLVQLVDKDPNLPGNTGSRQVATTEVTRPHGIVVNRFGRRFGDETSFQTLAPAVRAYDPIARAHSNLPCWLVFDQEFVDRFGYGAGYGGGKVGHVPDRVIKAPDLATLAERAGIDAKGLATTIAKFNEHAERGQDPEFARGASVWSVLSGTPCLGPIRKPPFYAARLRPFAMSSAGLRVDAHSRVQSWDGAVIPGLYAVGNAAVHSEYGVGYQAGVSLASAMTFGYLAARHMQLGISQAKETTMNTIYTATVTTVGGRMGRATSSDGNLDVALSVPKAFGGPGGAGTNPEQLFAAGYSACFESVLREIARQQKKALKQMSVTGHVNVHAQGQGFGLSVVLEVHTPDLPPAEVQEMANLAHTMCPYSNATRGNIEVTIRVV